MTQAYQGPLADLNVIDFGHYYAGPMTAMLLADQGANVIRIVRPGKPELPEQQYRLLNRNKKLLTLDLKTPEGKAQAESLIERADVVIENFRPGVMKRLDLDYSSVKASNPGLIYLSLPGFASTDKERALIQAWEGVIAAAAGLYTEAHFFRQKLNFPPVYASLPLSSAYGSMHGAVAVMAALVTREEQGVGTVIEAPLIDSGLSTITDHYMLRAAEDPNAELPDSLKSSVYSPDDSAALQLEKLSNAEEKIWGYMGYHLSSDGRRMLVQAAKPWHVERLFKALGLDEQMKREGFTIESAWKGRWQNNLAYVAGMSADRTKRAKQLIGDVLRSKTAEAWQVIMAEIGVPFTYVRTRDEWLALEPLLKSGVLCKMDNGQTTLTVPGRVADMSGPDGVLLENNPTEPEAIVAEQVDALFPHRSVTETIPTQRPVQKKSDLLKGLKVLDLCSIVAGPTASFTLAQFGAEVIRAEPPESFNLPLHLVNMLEVNQGKRSIVVDIKTAPGREIFRRLVCWAEVVIHNRLDDTAQRLGVTHAQLQEINSNVVVCQMSALGGTWRGRGGWETLLGFDPMANMPSGLLAHYGSLEHPMYFGGISADLMGGFGSALSALLGVYQRSKTGYAGEGRCSLARAVNYNQLVWMIAANGSSDWGDPLAAKRSRGQFALGPHWWQRIYRCADRWLYVETPKDRANVLAKTIIGAQVANDQVLELAFTKQDSPYWLKKLGEAKIACHFVLSADDICVGAKVRRVSNEPADECAEAGFEILRWDDHPCGKPIMLPAMTWVRVGEDHSYKRLAPTPKVGQQTREVLAELGYAEDEIEELIRIKVAHEFLPAIGSKDHYFFEPDNN